MTKAAFLPVPTEHGGLSYQGVSIDKMSQGNTPSEALDALTTQFDSEGGSFLVVVQSLHPDAFFGPADQKRLGELMQAWRAARDEGQSLPAAEQAELDALVERELRASARRAGALADDLGH